jgi:hypothetical protein
VPTAGNRRDLHFDFDRRTRSEDAHLLQLRRSRPRADHYRVVRKHPHEVAENAVLNANYIRKRLEPYYHLFLTRRVPRVVFSDKRQTPRGVTTSTS